MEYTCISGLECALKNTDEILAITKLHGHFCSTVAPSPFEFSAFVHVCTTRRFVASDYQIGLCGCCAERTGICAGGAAGLTCLALQLRRLVGGMTHRRIVPASSKSYNVLWGPSRHLGSSTAANWVSFDLNVSCSSCP